MLRDITSIAQLLQMNPIEIVGWSFWLDSFRWYDQSILDLTKLLRVTAFQIKASLRRRL